MKKKCLKVLIFLTMVIALDWGVAAFLQTGLERYYGLDQEADILLIGHSHMMKSCDHVRMEEALGVRVSKYCREGVMVADRFAMLQHFLAEQEDGSVPYVLYGVDPFMFNEGDLSLNSYKLFYPFMDSPPMDELVRREATDWHDYYIHKYFRSSRFTDNMIYRSMRGWFRYWKSFQNGVISDARWNASYQWGVDMPEEKIAIFRQTLDFLLENGCQVVLVHPPVIEAYRRSNPEAFEYMRNYYQQLADSDPRIHFLDYGPLYSHRQELFEDPVHVNRICERMMTEELIRDMMRIMGREGVDVARD